MYGLPINGKLKELKKETNLLIIVGGEKVPREIYELSDYNISITNQPHSELGALAIFLDRINDGRELSEEIKGLKKRIKPSAKGKEYYK
jgi:tRNA (cytidine56-2'-O)-methyltransferase